MRRLDGAINQALPSPRQPGALALHENLNPLFPQNRYPEQDPQTLKEDIIEAYKSIHGPLDLEPGNVLLTVGAVDALDLSLKALADPTHSVLMLDPAFVGFDFCTEAHRLKKYRLKLCGQDRNQIDVEKCLNFQADFILLNTPINPLGTQLAYQQIHEVLTESAGYVIVDEAYVEFAAGSSCLKLISRFPNLIVLRTFSKAFGLPHIRCGALVANSDVINAVRSVQVPFSVSGPAHCTLAQSLKSLPQLKMGWQVVAQEREALAQQLSQIDLIDRVFPSSANFICVQAKQANRIYQDLLSMNIQIARTVEPDLLRISIGAPAENLKLLEALKIISQGGPQ